MKILPYTTLGVVSILPLAFGATLLHETFDNDSGFTVSPGFFADTFGDFLGIHGSAPDFGGAPVPPGAKPYLGFTDNYLTGMDLDGEGAILPMTVEWQTIPISGETGLMFSGDFADFFDVPGDIDDLDSLFVEARIDGGDYMMILEFVPGSFSSTTGSFNGLFENGSLTLGDSAQNFTAPIPGTGNTLDLRLTVSVDSGDEDFAVDNFMVTSAPVPELSSTLMGGLAFFGLLRRRR